jgi:uncharacterized protein YerC
MSKVNLKTISYNLARQNYSHNNDKRTAGCTKWNSQSGERLLQSFSLAAKGGFMKEFLDDLLSDTEFKRLASKLFVLEMLFMGTPYSYMIETYGLSPKTISAISKKTANKKGGYYRVMMELYPRGFRYFE